MHVRAQCFVYLIPHLSQCMHICSASWYKRQKNNKRVLSKPDVNTVVSGDLEILDWNQTGIAEVSYVLLSNEALD